MSNTFEYTPSSRLRPWVLLAGIALFIVCGPAAADPPLRAARLAYISGAVSFSPAGEDDWVLATLNRPLTTGDRLWADADARAEVQVGGAAMRMDAYTSMTLLNLDDSIAQVQLAQGALKIRLRRLAPNQAFEIDTPNLALILRRPGDYRIEVDPAGDATTVMVQRGQGEVFGEGASYMVDSRQGYRFEGTGLRDYQLLDARRDDDFDRWARERDRRSDNSVSGRYVSSDVLGYEDLDGNGTWRSDPVYGNVWVPNHMVAGWTPYQAGHWAWVDPWGWTWVDDLPWGFAVSHYGRWAYVEGGWGWVPGPVAARAVYAPALVAFVGGAGFQLSMSLGGGGAVAWFPLAPRDVYRPSYAASRGYFNRINRSNTVINSTTITNVYNTTNVTNIVYANRQVPGAVVAVPTSAFVHARPVAHATVRVSNEALAGAPVSTVAGVAPVEQSVRGAAAPGARPPAREHRIVVRSAPPAAPAGLAAQQPQLSARPGRPLDEAARKQLNPVAPAPAPKVSVVTGAQAQPSVAPPQPGVVPFAVGTQAPPQAARSARRDEVARPAAPPRVEQPPVTPPQIARPAAASSAAGTTRPQRARPEPPEQTTPRAPPPLASPPQVKPPPVVTPPPVSPAPVVSAPQRARPEPRVQPAATAAPAAPAAVRTPATAAKPSPPPAPAAEHTERKPVPDAEKAVERRRTADENRK